MITVNNITYKDDFLDSGIEDKNYLRILFNGGRSVQIRELNQLQSILQSQLDKFGSSVWKTGVAVLGGACTFDRKVHAITFDNDVLINVTASEIDTLIQGAGDNAVIADVIAYTTNELTTTFYVRYSSGGSTDNADGVFDILTNIGLESRIVGGLSDSVASSEHSIVAGAFLSEGVFFINGSFVVTPKQNIFIPLPEVGGLTGSIVLNVIESNVTYIQDQSLLDNAEGRPNHLAPGADRYQITLTLDFLDSEADPDTVNRITLMQIADNNVVINSKARYTDIDRQLAQRTYEESGNYITNPFRIEITNLLDSQRPGSLETDASENVYIGLEPSVAYVDGYRIELSKKLDLTAPRARAVLEKQVSVSLGIGNYVDVSIAAGSNIPLPNTISLEYTLRNAALTSIGTCRIKSVESVGALFRLFLYDVNLTGAYNISDIAHIFYENGSDDIDVVVESAVQDTANDIGVFKLPYDNVRSVAAINPSDFTYVIKKTYEGVVDGSNKFTITTGANESFGDASLSNFIVEVNGTWLPTTGFALDASSSSSITIESSGAAWTVGHTVKVIFPVTVASNTPATKTLTEITQTALAPTGNKYMLSTTDIFDIVEVIVNGTAVDVTSDFIIFSDGQRPSKYTNGELQYTGAGTPPTIDVTYRHFVHSGLPFTANSYPINWDEDAVLAPDEIRYIDVPTYNKYSLADCVDFRPTILAGAGTLTAIQPDPNSALTCKPTFFLPRTDKVIVNSNGEFKIISGVPKLVPVPPATPPASMALYELEFPPYTFEAGDVNIKYVDNRRYTMRDISALDRRINNLEYYTSLSLLETSATSKSIFDEVQGQRFKNGILVDSFTGHGVGNVFNPAYACSIDNGANTLRPRFKTDSVDLVLNTGTSTDISINENTITLPFTETPLISQLKSSESESVNPYDVAAFIGNVKLYPTNDKWMEVNRRPDIIINQDGAYDALKFIAKESNILGTEWNSWKTNWSGAVSKTLTPSGIVRAPDGVMRARETTIIAKVQAKTGIKTKLTSNTVSENLGDRVIDISFVPFIRSRRVYFKVSGLKPFTKVYPFFDGISISDYAASAGSVVTTANTTSVREYFGKEPGDLGFITPTDLISDLNGELIGQFIIPNNGLLKFRTGERVFKVTDSSDNNPDEETTFAEGSYNSAGTTQTVEATILSTRVPQIKRERVEKNRIALDTKVRYFDPLAQTFVVNDIQEGVFVTSIDLWFDSKSKTDLPVTVRLVAVENGYPTQRVVPFSEVTMRASDVLVNGTATNFEFSDPVYLKSGVEYAIVVLSNDPLYRIRVARLGGTDEDGKIIQSNPYGGVMFMSQNASTWTADQTRDMKFVINRAVFDVLDEGHAEFKSIMREGIQSIAVTAPGASYEGATVTIGAPTEPGGVQATAEAVIDLISGTLVGVTVTDPGSGYITAPLVTIVPVGPGAGATAAASLYTAKVSAFNLIQGSSVQKEASLSNSLTFGATTYTDVDADENYEPLTEFSITHANRATIASTLRTTSQYITPVIDLDSMALLAIENEVNSSVVNEDTLDGGSALSRYITREVELNDPADQLNIYADVNRPNENTSIELYVKLKYDSETYSAWIPVAPQVRIPITDDSESYDEIQYVYNSASNDFISFSVKIVFTSTSTVSVTTVKNLRIIATS